MIAIAGAGIAGLTAALALAAVGRDTVILEASATLGEAGAGLQLSPNATRILRRLGVLEQVAATAVRPERLAIRRARDGAVLAALPLGSMAERRFGAPLLVTHRADLQAVLRAAVLAEPRITLRLGEKLAGIAQTGRGVRLAVTGAGRDSVVDADGLVAADGLHSAARTLVAAGRPDPLCFSGRTAWRSLMPAAEAPPYARDSVTSLWLGRRAHLVHYPVRGGTMINVVAITESPAPDGDARSWIAPGDGSRLRALFAGWAPDARALLAAAPEWRIWPLYDRPALARWTEGAVLLAGDAAHPMLPFLAQGAAQAIEDGDAIAAAVAAAPTFAAAAIAYDRARRPRAERVQRESRRQGTIYHLGAPAAQARDAAFRVLGADRMLARFDWLYGG